MSETETPVSLGLPVLRELPMRWFAEQFARFNGYFWLPCPACGQMFGGHETTHSSSIPHPGHHGNVGWMICPACSEGGRGWPLHPGPLDTWPED